MTGTAEGLRARKKAKTHAELQRHALRLFAAKGYAETTVDEIAAAAEVSRSTFFRYFANKEAVVLFDDVDALMTAALARQDPDTPLLAAVRNAVRAAFEQLSEEKRELEEVRMRLARTVPELQRAIRESGAPDLEHLAERLTSTAGDASSELDAQLFLGVIHGARLAARGLVERDPDSSYIEALDGALARLQDGIPLASKPIGELGGLADTACSNVH